MKPNFVADLSEEVKLGFFASKWVVGVDEVGRGCLAGSVVAAAVILDAAIFGTSCSGFDRKGHRVDLNILNKGQSHDRFLRESPFVLVKDSKLIPEPARAPLAETIKPLVLGYSIAEASVSEIEELNILYASHLAMERAVKGLEKKLGRAADHILVDGHLIPKGFRTRNASALIKGDQKSLSIASASILAKVYRDHLMSALDERYPGYGLSAHKGYPTPFHKRQILERGVTSIHRKTFKGVKLASA